MQKVYGADPDGDRRYSPSVVLGTFTEVITGSPDPKHISTSYLERQNLTMRMSMRRFTRLTNGFSKKLENHAAAVALHYMHYNFCRVHRTLRVTAAMEPALPRTCGASTRSSAYWRWPRRTLLHEGASTINSDEHDSIWPTGDAVGMRVVFRRHNC